MVVAQQRREIQAIVNRALNGAIMRGRDISRLPSTSIAQDLVETRTELAKIDPKELVPFIKSWWNTV